MNHPQLVETELVDANPSTVDAVSQAEPTETCRIFVSRKTSDSDMLDAASQRRKSLEGFANDNLEFYDAGNIQEGENWRECIRRELFRANILLLILTAPARREFDWLLYEAGLFDGLDRSREKRGRIVCIYPKAEKMPDQLKDIQGCPATVPRVMGFFKKLYGDKEFTNTLEPLAPKALERHGEALEKIASGLCRDINGKGNGGTKSVSYLNPYIQLVIPGDAKSVGDDIEIRSDRRSLKLFNLGAQQRDGKSWRLKDIKTALRLDDEDPKLYNLKWVSELKSVVESWLSGTDGDRQLSGKFIARDHKIWAPEIEIFRRYAGEDVTVDVTFSPRHHDAWLRNAKPVVALAANLGLASRVRHEVVESYLPKLIRWKIRESERRRGFSELRDKVAAIEHDGFFIEWLTRDRTAEAFGADDTKKLAILQESYGKEIRPKLYEALEKPDVDALEVALKLWRDNNAVFLSIAIRRYEELLGLDGHSTAEGDATAIHGRRWARLWRLW